jgi:hypothetical protein
MTKSQLERRVRLLTFYALGTTLLIVGVTVAAFTSDSIGRWAEVRAKRGLVDTLEAKYIKAHRLDIVEPDDTLALSLSNSERTPYPTLDGQEIRGAGERASPSIIFFDGHGDEVGGMSFYNTREEDGYTADRHFSWDGFKRDQVIYMSHYDKNGKAETGLYIRSEPPLGTTLDALEEMGIAPSDDRGILRQKVAEFRNERPDRFDEIMGWEDRLFVGMTRNGRSEVVLNDGNGVARIHMAVDSSGAARLLFRNAGGEVTHRYPPKQ